MPFLTILDHIPGHIVEQGLIDWYYPFHAVAQKHKWWQVE